MEFCRRKCPVLPDGEEVFRGSREAICEICGEQLGEHQKFAYPSGLGHCVRVCDGRFYHL